MKRLFPVSRVVFLIPCVVVGMGLLMSLAAAPADSKGVMILVEQRVKTLEQLTALTKSQYAAGQGTIVEFLAAERELLEAKIEVAEDRDARIVLLDKHVGNLKKTEAMVKARVANGVASQAEFLRAKAARLRAEIGLAREMEREVKKPEVKGWEE